MAWILHFNHSKHFCSTSLSQLLLFSCTPLLQTLETLTVQSSNHIAFNELREACFSLRQADGLSAHCCTAEKPPCLGHDRVTNFWCALVVQEIQWDGLRSKFLLRKFLAHKRRTQTSVRNKFKASGNNFTKKPLKRGRDAFSLMTRCNASSAWRISLMYLHIFTSSLSNSSSHPFQFPNQRIQHTHNPRSSNLCSLSRNPVVESFSLSSPSTSVPGRFLSNQATGDLCICETLPCLCFEVSSNSLSLRVLWLCCAVPLLDFHFKVHSTKKFPTFKSGINMFSDLLIKELVFRQNLGQGFHGSSLRMESRQSPPACSLSFIMSRSISVLLSSDHTNIIQCKSQMPKILSCPAFGVQFALAWGPCHHLRTAKFYQDLWVKNEIKVGQSTHQRNRPKLRSCLFQGLLLNWCSLGLQADWKDLRVLQKQEGGTKSKRKPKVALISHNAANGLLLFNGMPLTPCQGTIQGSPSVRRMNRHSKWQNCLVPEPRLCLGIRNPTSDNSVILS